jgi:hypothetical protein
LYRRSESVENDGAQPGSFSLLKRSSSMHYSCAIHKPSATRSQLLIFSTLATALLFETRGLVDDLSMAGARASVRVQMSTMTLGGRMQPGLYDQWPTRSVSEPIEIEPDPNSVISNDRDRGSTAQTDELPLHERRRRSNCRSVALLPFPKRYVRSRLLSRPQSSGQSSLKNIKAP